MAEMSIHKAQQVIKTHIAINAALDVLSINPVIFILNAAYKGLTAYYSYNAKAFETTLTDKEGESTDVEIDLKNENRSYALAGELLLMFLFPSASLSFTLVNALLNALINFMVDSDTLAPNQTAPTPTPGN